MRVGFGFGGPPVALSGIGEPVRLLVHAPEEEQRQVPGRACTGAADDRVQLSPGLVTTIKLQRHPAEAQANVVPARSGLQCAGVELARSLPVPLAVAQGLLIPALRTDPGLVAGVEPGRGRKVVLGVVGGQPFLDVAGGEQGVRIVGSCLHETFGELLRHEQGPLGERQPRRHQIPVTDRNRRRRRAPRRLGVQCRFRQLRSPAERPLEQLLRLVEMQRGFVRVGLRQRRRGGVRVQHHGCVECREGGGARQILADAEPPAELPWELIDRALDAASVPRTDGGDGVRGRLLPVGRHDGKVGRRVRSVER